MRTETKVELELLIKNAKLVDVEKETVRTVDIGITGANFSFVNGQTPKNQEERYAKIMDCTNKYVVPGLIDAHTHLELSLLSNVPFAEAVIPRGTTAAVIDCHDIVNVLGVKGLELFIEESKVTPLKSFFMVPPCVPSAVGLEDSGTTIRFEDVKKALSLPRVIGVAEVMDVHRVLEEDEELKKIIDFATDNGKIIDGHCPALPGEDAERYFNLCGAKTDHESTSEREVLDKLERAVWVHLRRTSFGQEYPYKKIFEDRESAHRVMLCSDGCLTPNDILDSGHIATFIRELIAEGVEPVKAIKAATINPATCYGIDKELGSVKQGKKADFLILSDLKRFEIEAVFINGKEITDTRFPRFDFPSYSLNTVKVKTPSRSQLSVAAPEQLRDKEHVSVLVMKLEKNSLLTKKIVYRIENSSGLLNPDAERDILKAVVMERHGLDMPPAVGFVSGFGLKHGAFGGSIGQDAQHIVVIGHNDDDILNVIETIKENQGGMYYSKQNQVLSGLELPIGGIVSSKPPETVAEEINNMNSILWENGCSVPAPYLTLSLQITLPVIPELKLTNRGLVDVNERKFVSLFPDVNNN